MFTFLELNRASSESSDLSSGSASPERATSPPRGPNNALERGDGHAEVNILLELYFLGEYLDFPSGRAQRSSWSGAVEPGEVADEGSCASQDRRPGNWGDP